MAKLETTISVRDIPEVKTLLEAQGAAILHILHRMQADGRLAYLIGPGSQTYDLLTAAYALAADKPVEDVRSVNAATLNPIPWPAGETTQARGATMRWPADFAGKHERVNEAPAAERAHGVTDDDGNLLLGQRGDGSPIWNDPDDPLPLRRVAHFTEDEARRKAWELAGAGYGPTGISELHHA